MQPLIAQIINPMPPAPVAGRTVSLSIQKGETRLPRICPGCGAAADTFQKVEFERNPFVRAGGYHEMDVPFCSQCVSLTSRRSRALCTARWILLIALILMINLIGPALNSLPGSAPRFLVYALRFAGAGLIFSGTLLMLRYIWLTAYKHWYFGFRITGAENGKLAAMVPADYAALVNASLDQ